MAEAVLTEAERVRRREFTRDSRSALALGMSLTEYVAKRDESAAEWCSWLRAKMNELHIDDALELLPMALAKVEEAAIAEARRAATAAARAEVGRMLRKAIAS